MPLYAGADESEEISLQERKSIPYCILSCNMSSGDGNAFAQSIEMAARL